MKVAKWGNSLAIRLPAEVVKELDLKIGDDVKVRGGRASIQVLKSPSRRELLAGLRKYRGRMPADYKFDRDEANERG